MNEFELVDTKSIPDLDGFYTDYTWYVNTKTGQHVMVFGDMDLYKPKDGIYDAEFDNEDEAQEWFDSFEGFGEVTESTQSSSIGQHKVSSIDIIDNEVTESTEPDHKTTPRFMYKGYIVDKCEDGFKVFTLSEWQFGKGLRLSETTVVDEEAAKNWIDDQLKGGTGVSSSTEVTESYSDDSIQTYKISGVDSFNVVGLDKKYPDTVTKADTVSNYTTYVIKGKMSDIKPALDYCKSKGCTPRHIAKKSDKKTESLTSQNMINDFIDAIEPVYIEWDHYIGDFDQFKAILNDVAERIMPEEDIDLANESVAHLSEETLSAVRKCS